MSLRQSRAIVLIFLLALVLRAAPNVWLEWNEPGWHASHINELEFYYDDVARSLIAGKGFVHSVNPRSPDSPYGFNPGTPFHFVPPLYAWLLGIEYFVFGPNVLVAKLIHSAIDAFVCVLLFMIGIRILDRRTALVAAALYAIYPLTIVTSTRLYYQTLLNLALCWIVLCLASRVTFKNGMWTGIAVGLSALAKPVTLPLILLAPLVRMLEGIKLEVPLKPYIVWSTAVLIASVLTLTPWTIRNYLIFDRFVPVQSDTAAGYVLLQGSTDAYIDLDVATLHRQYGDKLGFREDQFSSVALQNHLNHLRSNPFDYGRFLAKKFALAWYNTEGKERNRTALLIQIPFIVAAVVGLVALLPIWIRAPGIYIVGLVFYITGLQVPLFPLVRYTLAVMPLVMLPAAAGMMWAVERFVYKHSWVNPNLVDVRLGERPGVSL
jgi:4-amino-4-deoxy-L-arabinose transferase-like glycosyltransferase